MTNDILEQVVEDYFRSHGYFTQHNIKYRPTKKEARYAVHSDIDILGIHPKKTGLSKVVVASCKSWQGGINIQQQLKIIKKDPNTKIANKEIRKVYREILDKAWADALKKRVKDLTGSSYFTFYLMVTHFKGFREDWESFKLFRKTLRGCDIKLMNMEEMLLELQKDISITPAHSELSRLLQLIRAGSGKVVYTSPQANKKPRAIPGL